MNWIKLRQFVWAWKVNGNPVFGELVRIQRNVVVSSVVMEWRRMPNTQQLAKLRNLPQSIEYRLVYTFHRDSTQVC